MIHMEPKGPTRSGGSPPSVPPPSRRGEVAGGEGRGPAAPGARGDEAVFSPRAEEFRRIRLHLDGLSDTVSDRVAQLRALVERDAYVVDGALIADAMLSDEATARLLGLPVPR